MRINHKDVAAALTLASAGYLTFEYLMLVRKHKNMQKAARRQMRSNFVALFEASVKMNEAIVRGTYPKTKTFTDIHNDLEFYKIVGRFED